MGGRGLRRGALAKAVQASAVLALTLLLCSAASAEVWCVADKNWTDAGKTLGEVLRPAYEAVPAGQGRVVLLYADGTANGTHLLAGLAGVLGQDARIAGGTNGSVYYQGTPSGGAIALLLSGDFTCGLGLAAAKTTESHREEQDPERVIQTATEATAAARQFHISVCAISSRSAAARAPIPVREAAVVVDESSPRGKLLASLGLSLTNVPDTLQAMANGKYGLVGGRCPAGHSQGPGRCAGEGQGVHGSGRLARALGGHSRGAGRLQ